MGTYRVVINKERNWLPLGLWDEIQGKKVAQDTRQYLPLMDLNGIYNQINYNRCVFSSLIKLEISKEHKKCNFELEFLRKRFTWSNLKDSLQILKKGWCVS